MNFLADLSLIDLFGYSATFVLLISFTMKNIFCLRAINSIACLLFIGYGFLLSISWPIIISNAFIFLINIDFTNLSPEIEYGIGRTFNRLSLESTLGGGGAGRLPTWRAAFLLF